MATLAEFSEGRSYKTTGLKYIFWPISKLLHSRKVSLIHKRATMKEESVNHQKGSPESATSVIFVSVSLVTFAIRRSLHHYCTCIASQSAPVMLNHCIYKKFQCPYKWVSNMLFLYNSSRLVRKKYSTILSLANNN